MALVRRQVTIANGEVVSKPNDQTHESDEAACDRESIIAAWWDVAGESYKAGSYDIGKMTDGVVADIVRHAKGHLAHDIHTQHMPKWYENHWYALVPVQDETALPLDID